MKKPNERRGAAKVKAAPAKATANLEKWIDESMPFLFEQLGDLSALKNHGCLTVAQCAVLVPAILSYGKPGDASQTAAHYVQLALLDIRTGNLCAKHPESLLPYSQFVRMAEAGMCSADGASMPVLNMGWLVSLDEAERWFKSTGGVSVKFDGLKAELAKMIAVDMESADTGAMETAPAIPNERIKPVSRLTAQDTAILEEIRRQGYDPLALPKPPAGKSGAKADIRKFCLNRKDVFQSKGVFDDAWQRLRDGKDIGDYTA